MHVLSDPVAPGRQALAAVVFLMRRAPRHGGPVPGFFKRQRAMPVPKADPLLDV